MKNKDLKINFRYLGGNIACLSVDSIGGQSIHNDINNEEAIIIFNSLVGEKENCRTVKTLLEENIELKKQLEEKENIACDWKDSCLENAGKIEILETQQKEFIKYLEEEIKTLEKDILDTVDDMDIYMKQVKSLIIEQILQKYKEIIGVSNENKTTI